MTVYCVSGGRLVCSEDIYRVLSAVGVAVIAWAVAVSTVGQVPALLVWRCGEVGHTPIKRDQPR